MCGILGTIGWQPDDPGRAVGCLHHRGPDGQGWETLASHGRTVWLGQTRLAILDLSEAGRQPMVSRDGRWWVTFNGEIYNHLEIRRTLAAPFRGHSDTETLVEAIAQQGLAATLPRLNGMFAFAALDLLEGRLHLVRDPFGIKPVYYRETPQGLAFASEVRALPLLTGEPLAVDPEGLATFLTLRYNPSPGTLARHVHRLPPGHGLTWELADDRRTLAPYITPQHDRFSGTLAEAVTEYRDVLARAVGRQMLSDVPVGILLSGGIDSALVAALARDRGSHVPCFTVGYGDNHPDCELAEAADTARVLGLPHHQVKVTPELLQGALPELVTAMEEPLGTTSILPMWFLVRLARERVTVVLTGQGSDEPWGGYQRYQLEQVRGLLGPLAGLARPVQQWLPRLLPGLPEMVRRGLASLPIDEPAARFITAWGLFTPAERQGLIGSPATGQAEEITRRWLAWLAPAHCPPAEAMMRLDSRMNLADDLLLYGDKIAMSCALEARVPMLDLEVVRFVESLPLAYRVRLGRGATKIVHKAMAREYLPREIVHRRKKGFRVPFGQWARGPWREWITEVLLDPAAPHFTHLHRPAVEALWREHLRQEPDRERQIFALLNLALWWRNLDTKS